jgi:hypothetical protein
MSDKLQYNLTVGVSDGTDISELEEFIQTILLDLYENSGVESIKVTKDSYTEEVNEDIEGLLETVDSVNRGDIQNAIEFVRELEQLDDE